MARSLTFALAIFLVVLLLAWITQGTGVVRNDVERNIYIPEELTMPLQVQAAFNDEKIVFRYRWPAQEPHLYHDLLRYEGGQWVRVGKSVVGPQPEGIYEDRLSMMVDDGRVPEFEKYGGYITIGDAMRFFTDEAKKDEVKTHPYLGKKKQEEVGKHLPATRDDINDWASVVPEEQLAAQRRTGYFLDLWHWRAHRSNPIDKSDDQYVAEARFTDAGESVFFTNWDAARKQPKLMFDPKITKGAALRWQDLAERKLGFDDIYYMREDQAVPFDPDHAWQEGDVIPRRVLRPGKGSAADIGVVGKARWADGYWDVTLERALDTRSRADDKTFADQGRYTVAFAVHRNATGSRWHYVSLPVGLALGREGDLVAARFAGEAPDWSESWHEVTLFYPGQVSWPHLNSARHAGADNIRRGVPVKFRHSEVQLAHYGVEMEFSDAIERQWWWTVLAGVLLIVTFGIAINLIARRR